ncbi:MAG: BREX system Lon protease-like protein BrxL [Thermoguttaceae bacterium]|nr:BREX system Lon protease-like protein BrxL [Thermoguttaceae bacterium]
MLDTEKLRTCFPHSTVYKDQKLVSTFKSAAIPAFLRDWILRKKAGPDGRISDVDELSKYFKKLLPQRDELLQLTDAARTEGMTRQFLARIDIQFKTDKNEVTFAIPDLGIQSKDTLIEDYIWDRIKDDVVRTSGGWGLIQLGYEAPSDDRNKGKITLLKFKNFCPYIIDLAAFRQARENFTVSEWLDVLLGAIDYNPEGYNDWLQKHTMLTRLLPFVEPRINLVELAPPGTGKSYLFGTVGGKYGWLVSGGNLSRAKLLYDDKTKQDGLIARYDYVALDEIQTMKFTNPEEIRAVLQAYMEAGEATFGQRRIIGKAGIILLGNIPESDMNTSSDMFHSLPEVFHVAALLDRFHGFIEGRIIPRMDESLKLNGWALNTEYFSEILHLLRGQDECIRYRSVAAKLVDYPRDADTRDTEAILRVCTAYLKLLFPHVTTPDKIDPSEFNMYCLGPAVKMRGIIRRQLQMIDPKQFGNKHLAVYSIRDEYKNNTLPGENNNG